jgi:hypothetical protein
MAKVTPIDPAPVCDLDLAKLGAQLLLVPASAAQLGHASFATTLEYGTTEFAGPEAEFVRDMFTLTADEVTQKWYGGRPNAARLAAEATGASLAGSD